VGRAAERGRDDVGADDVGADEVGADHVVPDEVGPGDGGVVEFLTLDPASVEYGRVDRIGPLVRRVVARNPSKFTYLGTGTYIVGSGDVAVIDPGPDLDDHRDALAAVLSTERVRAILVTHCHSDHSPLAAWLSAETGASTFAFGPHPEPSWDIGPDDDTLGTDDAAHDDAVGGRDGPHDRGAAESDAPGERDGRPEVKVEESVDRSFRPDVVVATGDQVADGPGWRMTALHTPGHTSNHTCFVLASDEGTTLFSGDHVMGWSTTVVAPPDGDMSAYIESLRVVAGRRDTLAMPTHGPPIPDPASFTGELVAHRLERERQVLAAVRDGLGGVSDIVRRLYVDTPATLHRAAARSVLSHLVKLVDDGVVATAGGEPRPKLTSVFTPT
jgi:glyoxylase-like metal-dependent hydrolase (beta-lactamase superfamily II)